ncbi:MAG: AMP-binding protein, partial [Clostridia bacterium]|nr:AMP-binding protein [Clostridia bacterium]
MKIVFSTKHVNRASFLDLCRYAYDYGFSGFEIYDAVKERTVHYDSVLRREGVADAKRKLINRGLSVSALRYPFSLDSEEANADTLEKYVDMAAEAGITDVIVRVEESIPFDVLKEKLAPAVSRAERSDVRILFETVDWLSNTENILDIISFFSSAAIGASWNVRGTYFGAGESTETTIKTLGAYIKYVRLGDMKDGRTVLIGEGDLPVEKLINALSSLNYDGFICAAWNEEINDADIVLTHFVNYISTLSREKKSYESRYYNRSKTGTFVWKKYDVIDATFSNVLDKMVEKYPDQYAFKYPTLDYTRTYAQFRRDVDECAAALISLGVKAGDHVAVWATNVPEWYITFWATTKIGAVLVTVNTAYKIHEIEYLLKQSDTHTLVM